MNAQVEKAARMIRQAQTDGLVKPRDIAERLAAAGLLADDTIRKQLAEVMADYQDIEDERDQWRDRAKKAEAASAVDQGLIEAELADMLHRGFTIDQMARRICAAISDDPAVEVIRESDIAAVTVKKGPHGAWIANGTYVIADNADRVADTAAGFRRQTIRRIAIDRAIEAEQTATRVQAKARELWELARGECDANLESISPDHRAEYLRLAERLIEQDPNR